MVPWERVIEGFRRVIRISTAGYICIAVCIAVRRYVFLRWAIAMLALCIAMKL